MARSSCPACGATVDVAQIEGTEESVPLEIHTDASSDAPRYRIVKHDPMTAQRVPEGAVGNFSPDHRYDCPAFNAGRR